MATERFPLTLRQRNGEPAHAAAARLASRWGALDPRTFSRDLGHPFAALIRGKGVRVFADRAGLDPDKIVADSPVVGPASRLVALRGQTLRLGDWSIRSRRRCPLCLDEDRSTAIDMGIPVDWWATGEAWWDVRSIDVCIRHGVRLTDLCGACGLIQTWRRGLSHCRCGAAHGRRDGRDGDPTVSAYIMSRLAYGPVMSIAVLDAMALVDAVRAMELLGAAALGYRRVKPRRAEVDLPSDRLAGLRVAADWPAGFVDLLDRLLATRCVGAADGLMATYGWLYSELCAGDASHPLATLVAPVLRRHAVDNGVMARDEERLGATVPPTISVTEAARRIGRSFATTRQMLGEAGAVPSGSRRGVAFAIEPSVAATLGRPDLAPCQVLRVGRTQARSILQNERLASALDSDAAPALALLDAIAAKAESDLPDGFTPLPIACRNMSVPLASACERVLAGELRIARCGTRDEGLRGVWVRQADLAQLRLDRPVLGVGSVARLVGIHHDAALQLIRAGAFGARVEGRVDRELVTRFISDHVTAAMLARSRGTSSSSVRRALKAAGVEPAFGPPSVRQLIYRRGDIPVLH